jgi:hypothetical protein
MQVELLIIRKRATTCELAAAANVVTLNTGPCFRTGRDGGRAST